MSSDLLEDCQDESGCEVFLSMNSSGHAFLYVIKSSLSLEEYSATFVLTPDLNGIENAKKIENALKSWREHIEETELAIEDK